MDGLPAPTNDTNLRLRVHDLTIARAGRILFRPISFTLEASQVLVVKGANGSGKTTLLKTLAGFGAPYRGQIDMEPSRQRLLAWQGHMDGLKPMLTVSENLNFSIRFLGDFELERMRSAMEKMDIAHLKDMPCRYLSAGERRRVALARVLGSACPIWLLDEPTAPLDQEGCERLQTAIMHHLNQGGMAIIATHRQLSLHGSEICLDAAT